MTDGDTEELISLLDGIIHTGDVFTFHPPTACKRGTLVLALRYAGRLHPVWATEGKKDG